MKTIIKIAFITAAFAAGRWTANYNLSVRIVSQRSSITEVARG